MENLIGNLLSSSTLVVRIDFMTLLTAIVVDFVDVYEFIEWHRIYSVECRSLGCKGEALRSRWKCSITSATAVKRFTPPSLPSTPSSRSRSRTEERGSTAWNHRPAMSSSAMPASMYALCMSTRGCGGKIEHDQFRRSRLGMNTVQDRVADIVDVEVDQSRFWPKDHDVRNQLVVCVPFAV